jgi:hypothetical protein
MSFIGNKIVIKFCIIIMTNLLCATNYLVAQSLDSIQILRARGELIRAKEAIDNYLLTNPKSAVAFFTKAEIYHDIAKDPTYKSILADANSDAFSAINSAYSTDKVFTNQYLVRQKYNILDEISASYIKDGIAKYNAGVETNRVKNFGSALYVFKQTEKVIDFTNKLKNMGNLLDTNLLYYLTLSAIHSEDESTGILYAQKVADKGIIKKDSATSFEPIYQWLVYTLRTNRQEDDLEKYAQIANRNFPNSDYFLLVQIDWARYLRNFDRIIYLNNQLFTKGFNTKENHLNYLNDLFVATYTFKENTTAIQRYKSIFEAELATCIKLYPTELTSKLLAAKYYRNLAAESQTKCVQFKEEQDLASFKNEKKIVLKNLKKSQEYLIQILNSNPSETLIKEATELKKSNQSYLRKSK